MRLRFVLLIGVVCGALSMLYGAQTSMGSGTLDVTVTDPSGAVIPGATVKLSNAATGYTKTATTDANGVVTTTTNSDFVFSLDLDPQFAWVPVEHFFIHFGPLLNIPRSSNSDSAKG